MLHIAHCAGLERIGALAGDLDQLVNLGDVAIVVLRHLFQQCLGRRTVALLDRWDKGVEGTAIERHRRFIGLL